VHVTADIRPTYRTHVLNVLLVRLNRYPSIRISELLAGSSDIELLLEELKSYNIYFSNLTRTLCYNYVAIVVLEVTLT